MTGLVRLLPVLALLFVSTVLLTVLSTAPALAQKGIDLDVVDGQGKKLGEAKLLLEAQDGSGFTLSLTANKKGNIKETITGPPGVYKATFELTGYAPYTADLDIVDGQVQQGTITLLDQASWNLKRSREAFNEGVAKLQDNDEDGALVLFEESIALDATLPQPHALGAIIHANREDWDTAAASFTTYLKMSPNGLTEIPAAAPAAFLVARHFGDATAKAAALEVMRANDMAKDIAPDIYNEGVNATKAGDDAAAEAFFLEAIELDPNLLPAYRAIAAHHFNKQQWAKALPYVDKLLAPLPGSREGQRMGFYSHWELGNKDQAEAHAKAWFALTKDGAEEITQQAEASFEADQSDRARGLSEIVVRNAPDYANGHYLLGRILAGSGDVAGAKRELQRFLELAPDDAEAPAARMMLEGL